MTETHTRCQTGEEYSPIRLEGLPEDDINLDWEEYNKAIEEIKDLLARTSAAGLRAAVCNMVAAVLVHPNDAASKAFLRQLRAHAEQQEPPA